MPQDDEAPWTHQRSRRLQVSVDHRTADGFATALSGFARLRVAEPATSESTHRPSLICGPSHLGFKGVPHMTLAEGMALHTASEPANASIDSGDAYAHWYPWCP
jgi:hypothetical protein